MGGEIVETGEGPLLVVRREYPLSHCHGDTALGSAFGAATPDALPLLCRPEEMPRDAARLLFLDTETTGLAGGTGTYAFLVGVGYREDDRFVVRQYFMRDLDEEPALLAALAPRLAEASGIVTFNGGGFDLPLLETRFVLARKRWPAPAHVDLLRPARRVWAMRLDDCRLGTVEREVLGLVRDDDVAGALIPSLYFDFLRRRHATPLAAVFSHNRDDVLSLAAVLGWFARALGEPARVTRPEDVAGLGRLWERTDRACATACYERALDEGLGGAAGRWVRLRLARWAKREARWERACGLWESVARADAHDVTPWEELAKYHEHRRRDFVAAREAVLAALASAHARPTPAGILEQLSHRLRRLERRLADITARA
ncbi:MAG: ribonuclease H-like domain-containing protein [Candidatus Rokubacteria bacterium]|nr:ribonuclease H-like domain-containing protein [Candidatus Rokubacteria bacterium]